MLCDMSCKDVCFDRVNVFFDIREMHKDVDFKMHVTGPLSSDWALV